MSKKKELNHLDRRPGESKEEHETRVLDFIDENVWKDFANACIPRLREIAMESESDATSVKAIEIVLNRAFGKPKESHDLTTNGKDMPPVTIQIVKPKD